MSQANAHPDLARRLTAEALGTAILLISIVGSGILATKLASGNVAIAVMTVALAAGATLYAIITMFVSLSGAHFNPAVTLMVAALGELKWREVPAYIAAQIAGGCLGVVITNVMFDLPAVTLSTTARTGSGQWLGELVATFGLFATIWAVARMRPAALPAAVATYVFAAVWFTSSTCFANPAVTIGRAITDTLCGIRPVDVPAFIACQLAAAATATALFQWLIPPRAAEALEAVVPAAPQPAAAAGAEPVKRMRAQSGPLSPLD